MYLLWCGHRERGRLVERPHAVELELAGSVWLLQSAALRRLIHKTQSAKISVGAGRHRTQTDLQFAARFIPWLCLVSMKSHPPMCRGGPLIGLMFVFFSHQARVQGSASEQRGLPSPRVPRAAAPRHRISPACRHCCRQDKSCVSSLNAKDPDSSRQPHLGLPRARSTPSSSSSSSSPLSPIPRRKCLGAASLFFFLRRTCYQPRTRALGGEVF